MLKQFSKSFIFALFVVVVAIPQTFGQTYFLTETLTTDYTVLSAYGEETSGKVKNIAFTINSATKNVRTVPIASYNYRTATVQIFDGTGVMDMTGASTAIYGATATPAISILGNATGTFWIEGKPGLSSTGVGYVTMPMRVSYYEQSLPNAVFDNAIGNATMLVSTTEYGTYNVDLAGMAYVRLCRAGTSSGTGNASQAIVISLKE